MGTEVTTTKTFQEKMFERIRDNIGDLITEDELKKIVDAAIEKAFFEKQRIPKLREWDQVQEYDSVFVMEIRKLLEPQVAKACKDWMTAHPEAVGELIEAAIGKGIFNLLTEFIRNMVSGPLYAFGEQFKTQLRSSGINIP